VILKRKPCWDRCSLKGMDARQIQKRVKNGLRELEEEGIGCRVCIVKFNEKRHLGRRAGGWKREREETCLSDVITAVLSLHGN